MIPTALPPTGTRVCRGSQAEQLAAEIILNACRSFLSMRRHMQFFRRSYSPFAVVISVLIVMSASVSLASAELLKERVEKTEVASPVRIWKTQREPKAVAVLLHGITASAQSMNDL